MSAALGAALKKLAVALLSDPKTMKKVLAIVLTFLVAIIMPVAAVIAIFSTDFEIDVPEFQRMAIQNLTPEQRADLQFIEDTGNEIQAALTARGQEKRLKEALVLFLFALGDFAHEPDFVTKLAGCFVEGQTHAELIAAVNTAFGTNIDPEDFEKIMGLDIGADDYIVKPFSPGEVMARVRAVLRRIDRGTEAAGKVLRVQGLCVNLEDYSVSVDSLPVRLTKREVDMLWTLVQGRNRAYTREMLLDLLWGYDYYGDPRTVDSHMKRLRAKLDVIPHPAWEIRTIRNVGYKFEVLP